MRYWKHRDVPGSPRVGVGVACYLNEDARRVRALECLVASFLAQTYPHWKVLVVHDGPLKAAFEPGDFVGHCDGKVEFVATAQRLAKFGHPHRQRALNHLCSACDWVMLTNDDNYYVPTFLEALLHAAADPPKPACQFVYCNYVASHKTWKPVVTEPRYKHLDLGGFMVRASLAKQVPFDRHEFNGDGDWINRLAAKAAGRVRKVAAHLFVHN